MHLNIALNNPRRNIDNLRKIVAFINTLNLEVLILPYMHLYGPFISDDVLNNMDQTKLKEYISSSYNLYIHKLVLLAKNYGLNIFTPGVIEVAGARRYVSAILVRSFTGEVERYRKIILSSIDEKLKITRGNDIHVFKLDNVSFTAMIENDILYPELARLNLLFSDFMVIGLPQNEPVKKYESFIKIISKSNNAVVIVPGAIVYKSTNLYTSFPTLIYDETGELIYKYSGDEQALIIIPVSRIKRREVSEESLIDFYRVYKLIKKYFTRCVKYEYRKSDYD